MGQNAVTVSSSSATALSRHERAQFKKLDEAARLGMRSFMVVGIALQEIRDRRLYREEFKTFEAYVRERFGMARRRAYQLVDAAEACKELRNVHHGTHSEPPPTERVARELVPLTTQQREETWTDVLEWKADNPSKPITAKIVRAHLPIAINPTKQKRTATAGESTVERFDRELRERIATIPEEYRKDIATVLERLATEVRRAVICLKKP